MPLSSESLDLIIKTLAQRLFDDEKVIIRIKSAESLGKLGNEKAIIPLCQALEKETDIDVTIAIMDAIVQIEQSSQNISSPAPTNQVNNNFYSTVNTNAVNVEGDQYNNPDSKEEV